MRLNDLRGRTFGRLDVLGRGPNRKGKTRWLVRCACDTQLVVYGERLLSGETQSCGCLHRELMRQRLRRHGGTGTAEYRIWKNIVQRCANSKNPAFGDYGGRGIRLCERWQDFAAFLSDMGSRPSPQRSIDRIHNDGDYEPGNCRWATRTEQNNNSRQVRYLELSGRRLSVRAWAEELCVSPGLLYSRLHRGWSTERTLSQ